MKSSFGCTWMKQMLLWWGTQPTLMLQVVVPREPHWVFYASGWCPLGQSLVWGILGTKTFPATAVSLGSVSFAIIAPLQCRAREEKVLAPHPDPATGMSLLRCQADFFPPPYVISDSRLLENKVQASSETDDTVFQDKGALPPLLQCIFPLL